MDLFENTRTDSSPCSSRSGTSTPLYFSDTNVKLPIQAAEMTESSIHVKYDIDEEELLHVGCRKMSGARRRKIERLRTCDYSEEEAYEKSLEHLNSLPSPDMKTGLIIPPSARSDLLKPDHKDIMKRYKMSGARRKRYKWLIMHGYSKEEAAMKSSYPMPRDINQTENRSKDRFEENLYEVERNLASNFVLTNENKEAARLFSPPKSIMKKEISVQIGIFPVAFPEVRFGKKQFEALQDCLSEHILKDTVSMPQFHGTICKNGWLQIICANMTSVKWAKDIIPFLEPWKGARFVVLEEKDFPKPMNLICFLPKSSMISNECILDYLQKQNPKNLDTDAWKILYREDSFDMTKAIFSIDGTSAFLLTRDGAKLYYMLNFVDFMVINTQLHGSDNGPNFINDTEKSMKPAEKENIARPSRYNFESSSFPSRIEGKNIRPPIKSNEYNIPDTKDRFVSHSNRYISHHNFGGYTSTSPLRNFKQEIHLLEDQLRHDRRDLVLELELDRKCQPYTPKRSRSPKRYYNDHRNRHREGNSRGSNSLPWFPRRY